tara:strand:- start:218 stop:349 length:132 start_codon:yes stop_codon:yes gene_type:complete
MKEIIIKINGGVLIVVEFLTLRVKYFFMKTLGVNMNTKEDKMI